MSNGITIRAHTAAASGADALQALSDHVGAALGPAVVARTIAFGELTL